jgi:hypothetical protein
MTTPKNKFINGQQHIEIGRDNRRAPIYGYVNNEEIINSIINGNTKYYILFDNILNVIRKEKKEIDFVKKILNSNLKIHPELFLKLLRTMKNENKNKITELTKDEKHKLFNFLSKNPNYEIINKLIKTPEGKSILVEFLNTINKNRFINKILQNPNKYMYTRNLFKNIFELSQDNNKTQLINKLLSNKSHYDNYRKQVLFKYLLNDKSVKNSLVKIIKLSSNRQKNFQTKTKINLSKNNIVKNVPKPPPPTLPIKPPNGFVSGEYTEQMGKKKYYGNILKTKQYNIPNLYKQILKNNYYKTMIERPNLPQPVRIELMRKKAHNALSKRLENLKKVRNRVVN